MLSLFAFTTVLLAAGTVISYLNNNFIFVFLFVAAFLIVVTLVRKQFLIGLVVIFVVAIFGQFKTFKIVFNTLNYTFEEKDTVIKGTVKDFFDITGENYVYYVTTEKINGSKDQVVFKIYSKELPPPKFAQVEIVGRLSKNNENIFSYQNSIMLFPENLKVTKVNEFYNFLSSLRLKIIKNVRSTLKSEQGNLLISTLTGINALETDTKESFQTTGTAHIFAISGLHVGVVFLFFNNILFNFLYPLSPLLSVFLTLLFLIFIGLKFSAIRAFIMLTLVVLSNYLGRGKNLLNTFLVSVSIILIFFPDSIISISFYLSCLALLGIIVSLKFSKSYPIMDLFKISFFVNLYETPLLMYFFNNISLISILLNIIVVPLVSILIPIGLIFLIVLLISVKLASYFSPLVNFLYGGLLSLISISSKLPFAYVPVLISKEQIVILGIVLIIFTLLVFNKVGTKKKHLSIIFVAIFFIILLTYNNLSIKVSTDSFAQSNVISVKAKGKIYVIVESSSKVSRNSLKNILAKQGINRINNLILLKEPSIKEGAQINDLKQSKIQIDRVFASRSVNEEFLKLNFSKYTYVDDNFILNEEGIKIVNFNNVLKIYLKNNLIYP